MRPLWIGVCLVAAVIASGPARGQPMCGDAIAHVADCAANYCQLIEGGPDCQDEMLMAVTELWHLNTCTPEEAESVLHSSCAALADSVGARSPGEGDVCARAVEYFKNCTRERCNQPDAPGFCEELLQSIDEEEEPFECSDEAAAEARAVLELTCEQLWGF